MKFFLISKLIQAMLNEFAKHAPDLLRGLVDVILDYVEDYVLGTKSEVDDAVALPICKMMRDTFQIPDDD